MRFLVCGGLLRLRNGGPLFFDLFLSLLAFNSKCDETTSSPIQNCISVIRAALPRIVSIARPRPFSVSVFDVTPEAVTNQSGVSRLVLSFYVTTDVRGDAVLRESPHCHQK